MKIPFFKNKKTKITRPNLGKGYGVGDGRLFGDWNTTQTSANTEIELSVAQLRNNARDLYITSDYVRRFISLMKTNVVGHAGIMLKMKAFSAPKQLDVTANLKIKDGWNKFGRLGMTTVCGRYSIIDVLKQIIHSVPVDGEILIRFIKYKQSPFKFALQIIEADHLDEKLNKKLSNGNIVKMGVEVDSFNRAVAYWVLKYHPGDQRAAFSQNEHERIPASEILHIFVPERPGQVRGVTWIASPAERLKMLDGFEEASLVAARVGASTMGIIHNDDGEEWTGDDPESSDNESNTTVQDGDIVFSAEAGTFKQLTGNKRVEKWNPAPPGISFNEFIKGVLRGVSSGLNISYENLANDRSDASYSSMRQAEVSDRDNYRILQTFMIERFCQPVFESWLYMALSSGTVKLPFYKYDQFNAATWRPRGWMWVDPDKESKAAERDIANGIESAEDLAARRGSDIFENIEENSAVKQAADKEGLKIPAFYQIEEVPDETATPEN